MEILDRFFILFKQHYKRPDCMDKHQDDGDQAGYTVNVKGQSAHHF